MENGVAGKSEGGRCPRVRSSSSSSSCVWGARNGGKMKGKGFGVLERGESVKL